MSRRQPVIGNPGGEGSAQGKIIGGAVTKFGRHLDRNLKSLVEEAVVGALKDAGIEKEQLQGAWVGNAAQGVLQGQESIRGQVVLRSMGIGGIPVINVENACASSATALNGAWAMVALGEIDVALVVGMEKMYFEDRGRVLPAFTGAMDQEILPQIMEMFAKQEAEIKKAQEARGRNREEEVRPANRVHGRVRHDREGTHGQVRHDPEAAGRGLVEEPLSLLHEPACPVPEPRSRWRKCWKPRRWPGL